MTHEDALALIKELHGIIAAINMVPTAIGLAGVSLIITLGALSNNLSSIKESLLALRIPNGKG